MTTKQEFSALPADFKKLMVARFLFTFAVQMQAVALGWRMYTLTSDALYLGFIGLAEAVPAIGLALFAGWVVDRSRPLLVYRRVVYVSLVSGLVMLVTQLPSFGLSVSGQVIALFASSLLTGTARAFSQPAMYATVPRLLERSQLPRASAWMTTAMQIARISGPAVGGVVFGFFGLAPTSVVVCAGLLLAAGSLMLIQTSPSAPLLAREPVVKALLSGARFVFAHPILFPALSLDMVSVFFGGVTALLPIYAAEILMIGPKGLGALRAAPAVGAAIMSLWLASFDFRHRAGRWLFTSVFAFGVCTLVFAISRNFTLSLVALALSGAFDSISMVIRTSAVQLSSPDAMRGRISSVNSMFIGSSNEIGEFESGVAAKLLGTVPAAIFGATACLVTVVIVAARAPRLRKLDLNELQKD